MCVPNRPRIIFGHLVKFFSKKTIFFYLKPLVMFPVDVNLIIILYSNATDVGLTNVARHSN